MSVWSYFTRVRMRVQGCKVGPESAQGPELLKIRFFGAVEAHPSVQGLDPSFMDFLINSAFQK